jgi:hypothetical protein
MSKICGSEIPGGLHLVGTAYGEQANDSCREELKFSTCDIDAVKHESTKCMSCIKAHKEKIDAGLVAGAKCTALKLEGFCRAQKAPPVVAASDKTVTASDKTVDSLLSTAYKSSAYQGMKAGFKAATKLPATAVPAAAPTSKPSATPGGEAAAAAASAAARTAAAAAAEPRSGKVAVRGVQSKASAFFGPPVVVLHGANPAVVTVDMTAADSLPFTDPGAMCLDPELGAIPSSQHPLHVSGMEGLQKTLLQLEKAKGEHWAGANLRKGGHATAAAILALSKLRYRRRHELVYICVNKRGAESAPVKRAVVIEIGGSTRVHHAAPGKKQDREAVLLAAKRPVIELKGPTPMLVLQSAVVKLGLQLVMKDESSNADTSGGGFEVWRKLDPGARCIDPLEGELAGRIGMDAPGSLTLGQHTVVYSCTNVDGVAAAPVERVVVVVTAFNTPMIFLAGPNPLALPHGIPLPQLPYTDTPLAHPPAGYTMMEEPGVKCVDVTDGDITAEALTIHIRPLPKGVAGGVDAGHAGDTGQYSSREDEEHVGVYAGKGSVRASSGVSAVQEASDQVAQIEYTCMNRRGGDAVPQVRLVMVANGEGRGDAFSAGAEHQKFEMPAHMASWIKVLEHEEELEQRRQETDTTKAHNQEWDPRPQIEVLGPNPLVIDPRKWRGQTFVDPGAACIGLHEGALPVETSWSTGADLLHQGGESKMKESYWVRGASVLEDGVHVVEYTCTSRKGLPAIPVVRRVILMKGAAAVLTASAKGVVGATGRDPVADRPVIYTATKPIVVSLSLLKKYPGIIGDLAKNVRCIDPASASAAAGAAAAAAKAGTKLPVQFGARLPVKARIPYALQVVGKPVQRAAAPAAGEYTIQYDCEGLFKAKPVNRTVEVLSDADWAKHKQADAAYAHRGELANAARRRKCAQCVGLTGPCRKHVQFFEKALPVATYECTFFEKQKAKGEGGNGRGEVCPVGWERCDDRQEEAQHGSPAVVRKAKKGGSQDDDADTVTAAVVKPPSSAVVGSTASGSGLSDKCTTEVELACAKYGRPLAQPLPTGDLRGSLEASTRSATHKAHCQKCVDKYIWATPPPTPSATADVRVSKVAASLMRIEHQVRHSGIVLLCRSHRRACMYVHPLPSHTAMYHTTLLHRRAMPRSAVGAAVYSRTGNSLPKRQTPCHS